LQIFNINNEVEKYLLYS